MKWWGKFILACLGVLGAFFGIFHGSVAAVANFGSRCAELVLQLNVGARERTYEQAGPRPRYQTEMASVSPTETAQDSQFYFHIRDELSDGQTAETTRIYFGDAYEPVGVFNLTEQNPRGRMAIRAESGIGDYLYRLDTNVVVNTALGRQRIRCAGSGTLRVAPGRTYVVMSIFDPPTDTCTAMLQ